jgi:hypothetical protein
MCTRAIRLSLRSNSNNQQQAIVLYHEGRAILPSLICEWFFRILAEEKYFGIPRNHRARDD